MAGVYEAKILEVDPARLARAIEARGGRRETAGAIVKRRWMYTISDRPDPSRTIHLSDDGAGRITLTVRSAAGGTLEEMEFDNFDAAGPTIRELGGNPEYKEEHTELPFRLGDATVTICRWPHIPAFLQIEGRGHAHVVNVAGLLGYGESQLIEDDMPSVYERYGRDILGINTLAFNYRLNPKPRPGTGEVRIHWFTVEGGRQSWSVGWMSDEPSGALQTFGTPSKDAAIAWARSRPATRWLIAVDEESRNMVTLDGGEAVELEVPEGTGWTAYSAPGDNHTRAVMDAMARGDMARAAFHMTMAMQKTLGNLEWEVKAMNMRRISDYGSEYPPEAEPTYDQAKQAAEAGDYPKSIAYGLMYMTEMLSFQNSRLDEIVHLMKEAAGLARRGHQPGQ